MKTARDLRLDTAMILTSAYKQVVPSEIPKDFGEVQHQLPEEVTLAPRTWSGLLRIGALKLRGRPRGDVNSMHPSPMSSMLLLNHLSY